MLSIKIRSSYHKLTGYILCILYFISVLVALNNYYLWNANLFIGLTLTPYICSLDKGKFSLRYLIPSITLIVLAILIPVRTTIFLALLFSFLFFLENYIGKISSMFLFLLLLVSPIFKYISNVLGFPIRLWISEVAAQVLNWAGTNTHAYGNIIVQANNEFSVDQACAGLNMLNTSLIICLFIITYYQKRENKRFSFLHILFLLILAIGLNITCNLIRIVLLVQFTIVPKSIYHDLIGLLCLLVYVIIPLLFLVKKSATLYTKRLFTDICSTTDFLVLRYGWIHFLLLAILLFTTLNIKSMDQITPSITTIKLEGYRRNILSDGILKFENHESLVYLKSGVFYAPEHDPMVCWKGSGYIFQTVKKEKYGFTEIYTGKLKKGNDTIYSAWWFDNGSIKTINQFNWRWRAAKGERNFYLINANAQNAAALKRTVISLLSKNLNF